MLNRRENRKQKLCQAVKHPSTNYFDLEDLVASSKIQSSK